MVRSICITQIKTQLESVRSEQKAQPSSEPSALMPVEHNKVESRPRHARLLRDSDLHSNRYSVAMHLPLASKEILINIVVFSACTLSDFIKLCFHFWFALLFAGIH